jgi:hypothetical protein
MYERTKQRRGDNKMAKAVGLSREQLIQKFEEARIVLTQPEALKGLGAFPKLYKSEELNEAIKLIEAGLMATLIVINQNNEAIAEYLRSNR